MSLFLLQQIICSKDKWYEKIHDIKICDNWKKDLSQYSNKGTINMAIQMLKFSTRV